MLMKASVCREETHTYMHFIYACVYGCMLISFAFSNISHSLISLYSINERNCLSRYRYQCDVVYSNTRL